MEVPKFFQRIWHFDLHGWLAVIGLFAAKGFSKIVLDFKGSREGLSSFLHHFLVVGIAALVLILALVCLHEVTAGLDGFLDLRLLTIGFSVDWGCARRARP